MRFIYNIGIFIAGLILQFAALFNNKIKKGVVGRKETFEILASNLQVHDKTIWFHCASLGEYEQGLPLFSELRKQYKTHKIILSFFSPSGYDIRKNTPIADIVIYLPLDTKANAKRFLNTIKPELTVFVKYDIWPNFLNVLREKKLSAILISASFRKNQTYFKFYGSYLKDALFAFDHIFTQNEVSKKLLESINYKSVTVSGDTRYDRVSNQLNIDNSLDFIQTFKNEQLCVIGGSTWPESEALFTDFINSEAAKNIKFIIAPHDIKPERIKKIQAQIHSKSVLFSEKADKDLSTYQVFIVDTIGILSKIYSYADIAYVGGALGTTGLHNTLEPAVFGIPIIIGNKHSRFPEAQALIDNGGMYSIANRTEFDMTLNKLIKDDILRIKMGLKNRSFILNHKGAIEKIINYLQKRSDFN